MASWGRASGAPWGEGCKSGPGRPACTARQEASVPLGHRPGPVLNQTAARSGDRSVRTPVCPGPAPEQAGHCCRDTEDSPARGPRGPRSQGEEDNGSESPVSQRNPWVLGGALPDGVSGPARDEGRRPGLPGSPGQNPDSELGAQACGLRAECPCTQDSDRTTLRPQTSRGH